MIGIHLYVKTSTKVTKISEFVFLREVIRKKNRNGCNGDMKIYIFLHFLSREHMFNEAKSPQ